MRSPKCYILSPDSAGKIDGTVTTQLLDFLPNKVSTESAADVVIVVLAYMPDFHFNFQLLDIKKPVVLFNYLEFGWSWNRADSNLLGAGNLTKCGHLNNEEWATLDNWVRYQPPRLEFQRELFQRDVTPARLPVEWLCYLPASPAQDKESFDARPFDVLNVWGLSNPVRPRLHGNIFIGSQQYGYNVIDAWGMDQSVQGRTWVTIFTPWQSRQHINELMRWQRRAKLSVSLPGCGWKCFRHSESIVDCVMALPYDPGLAWTYPFEHGVNCIRLNPDNMLADLDTATKRTDLHEIYLRGLETADKYRSERYVAEYILPKIAAVL